MSALVVYLAGPYSQPDPVENTHNAVHAATSLYRESGGRIAPIVPHTSMLWHAITPMPYQDWLDIDLAVVAKCDVLVRLAGESSGADGEVAFAQERGIPVVTWDDTRTTAEVVALVIERGGR